MNRIVSLFLIMLFLPMSAIASYLPLQLVNNTKIADDSAVYIVVKATDPSTKKQCLVHFDKDGNGTCEDVTAQTQFSNYSYALSTLPADGSNRLVHLPKVDSGRIYFSVGTPMDLYIDASNPGSIAVVDPDGFKPRDVNYYTLFDKIEFSYNDMGAWVNPTAVDFFSLPIGLQLPGSTSGFTQAGLTQTRAAILNQVQTTFNDNDKTASKIWNTLFLNYQDDQGTNTVLRLVATGKAMVSIPDVKPFDSHYLSNQQAYGFSYIDFLWTYYQTNTLTVDCSELAGNPQAPKLDNYIFTGRVIGQQFIFTNQTGTYSVPMDKPTASMPFFAGAGLLKNPLENNGMPGALIVREFTSAFDAGLLPAPSGTTLGRDYFSKNKTSYFQNNPLIPKSVTQGPWYDLYSKALHSFGSTNPIYTFAYDDALCQDGTLYLPNNAPASTLTVTLGDLTGTKIPSPWQDSTTYSVTVGIGTHSVVKYIKDPKDRSKDVTLQSGQTLPNVSIPFNVELNGEVMAIYIKHPMVKPFSRSADGVVISHSGAQANIIFPGR